ncbi:hypothetical protein E1171_16870 [Cytophagales bacterium RKSG123]|nr:hypothetical protein [Xanthovirga aplysinae]
MDKKVNEYLNAKGVKYFNFAEKQFDELANPWLWKDNAHLNFEGAKIFSSLFKEDLKRNRRLYMGDF